MRPLGLYFHIPYCIKRCKYCSFYSTAVGAHRTPSVYARETVYIDRQIRKIEKYGLIYGDDREVDTIYIGGGTPTILEPEMLRDLLDAVRADFRVSEDCEITVEANPKTLTEQKLRILMNGGVNRLSIGAQSFSDDVLRFLGRAHSAQDIRDSYRLARDCGMENINLDLMFGIPGQTFGQWLATIREATRLEPEHISFYSLQLEEGTPLYRAYRAGEIPEINEKMDRRMYHSAIRELKENGYEHYEISNAAKPGFQCRHNLKYWRFEEYLGIGDNASSYIEGARFREEPDSEYHLNDFMDDAGEYTFLHLRLKEGVDKKAFAEKFGRGFWDVFGSRKPELEQYFNDGLLIEEGGRLHLSEEGIDVSNEIMAVFV